MFFATTHIQFNGRKTMVITVLYAEQSKTQNIYYLTKCKNVQHIREKNQDTFIYRFKKETY